MKLDQDGLGISGWDPTHNISEQRTPSNSSRVVTNMTVAAIA
jgi:hypothetical protein